MSVYRCSECGERFNTQTDLEFHIDVSHLRLISNQCWHCHQNKVETFKSTEDLLRLHYKQVHSGITCTLLKNIDDDKEAKRKDIIRKSKISTLISNTTNDVNSGHIATSSILIQTTGPTPPRPLGPTPPLAQSSPIVSNPLANVQVKKENDEKDIKQELIDDGKNGSDQNQQLTSGNTPPATEEHKCDYCQQLRPDKNYGIDLRTYDTKEAKRDHVITHIESEHSISLRNKSGQIELGEERLPLFWTIFEYSFPKVNITDRQSQENTNFGSNQVTTCQSVQNRSCQPITSKIVENSIIGDSNVRLNDCEVSISEADQQRVTNALEKEKNNDPSFRKVSNDSKRPACVKRKEKVFVGPITKKRKIPDNAVIEHSAKSRISSISRELNPGAPLDYDSRSTNDQSVAVVPKSSLDKRCKDRSPSTTPINIRSKRPIEDHQSTSGTVKSKRSKRDVTPAKQMRKVEKTVKTNAHKPTNNDDDDDIIYIGEIQSPVKENRRFHCKSCKGSMKTVIQHLFKVHYKTSVVRCPLCDFPSFFSIIDMRNHIITKHPNSKATPIDSRQKHKQQIKDLWKDHIDDSLPPDFGKIFANEVCKMKIKKEPKNESADEPEIILHQRFVRIGLEDERNSHVTSSPPEVIRESPPEMDKSPQTHTKVQQSSPPALNSLAQNSGQSPPALENEIEIIGEVKMVKKRKSKKFTMPKKRKGLYCKVCKGSTWKPKAHLYQRHLCEVTVKCPYCDNYPGTTFKTPDVYAHVKLSHPDKEARIVDERDNEDIRNEAEKLSLKCFGVKVFELKKEHAVECVKADRKENNPLKRVQYGLRPRLQEVVYSDESILRANLLKEAQKEEDERKRLQVFLASHEKPPPEPSCDICGQFCDDLHITEDKLSDHKLICEKVNRFCCNLCPRRFRMRQALTIHKQHKHKDYNCKFCSTKWDPPDLRFQTKEKAGNLCYKFQEKIARHNHLCHGNLKQQALISQNVAAFHFQEEIIENPIFPSREKKSCYMLRGQTNKIAINISPETPKKAKPYSCALCGSQFAQLKSLTIHKIFCQKQREQMETVQNDLLSTKFNAETAEIEKEQNEVHVEKECIECKETIGSFESNIELHLVLKHLGKDTVKCSQCSFSHLWQKSVIYRHINDKHDTKGCVIDMRDQFRDSLKMLRKKLIRSVGGNLDEESGEKEMSDSNSSNSGDVLSDSNERNSSPPELSPHQFPISLANDEEDYECENVSDSAFSDEDEDINNTGVDIAKIIEGL